ncbi:MAG: hypothetical protein V1911_03000 [Candidatus Micrarchaeota archaeon]
MEKLTENEFDKILNNFITGFDANDAFYLREQSNELIERAMITGDSHLVKLSLISYGLSKLVRKPHLMKSDEWGKFKSKMIDELKEAVKEPNTLEQADRVLDSITEKISAFDKEMGNYMADVMQQARVKQASRVYSLGVSLSKAAELTGVQKNELFDYIGITKIHERPFTQTLDLKTRYKKAREVFGE